MQSLVRFIQARITEDEVGARAEQRGGQGVWSAQRVLDECAAKRAVIAALERDIKAKADDDAWDWLDEESALSWIFGDSKEDKAKKLASEILRAMAKPYAGHPDCRPEWLAERRRTRKFW